MTVRTVAACLAGIALACGLAVLAAAQKRCSGEQREILALSRAVEECSQRPPGSDTPSKTSPGEMTHVRRDRPPRLEYQRDGELLAVDRLGADGRVVRRDLLDHGRVRAREYFSDGQITYRTLLGDDGSVLCADNLRGMLGTLPLLQTRPY